MKKTVILLLAAAGLATAAQAQMIGATNSSTTPRQRTQTSSPYTRPTGPYLRIAAGFPLLFSLAYNQQLTPWLMVGGGAGVGTTEKEEHYQSYTSKGSSYYWWENSSDWRETSMSDPIIPLYVEAEVRTPNYKWSLFLNLRLGANLGTPDDSYPDYPSYSPTNSWDSYYSSGYVYQTFYFSIMAGVGYKNMNLGAGYTTNSGFGAMLSYSLPLSLLF